MKFLFLFIYFFISNDAFSNPTIEIKKATLKLPPTGSTTSVMFAEMTNNSQRDVHLIKVTGDIANEFELHTMDMSNGHMSMRKVEKILIKKNSTTLLASGGDHIMIFNLKKPLKEEQAVEIEMHFDNQEKLKVKGIVKKD
jgi:hypothetical protein